MLLLAFTALRKSMLITGTDMGRGAIGNAKIFLLGNPEEKWNLLVNGQKDDQRPEITIRKK